MSIFLNTSFYSDFKQNSHQNLKEWQSKAHLWHLWLTLATLVTEWGSVQIYDYIKTYKRKWYGILQISFEIIRWQCPQRNKSLFQRTFLDLWKWYSFHLQSDPRLSAKNSKTSFMVGCLALYFPPFSRSEIFLVQDQQSLEVIFVQNWEKWKKQQKAMQYLNLFYETGQLRSGEGDVAPRVRA